MTASLNRRTGFRIRPFVGSRRCVPVQNAAHVGNAGTVSGMSACLYAGNVALAVCGLLPGNARLQIMARNLRQQAFPQFPPDDCCFHTAYRRRCKCHTPAACPQRRAARRRRIAVDALVPLSRFPSTRIKECLQFHLRELQTYPLLRVVMIYSGSGSNVPSRLVISSLSTSCAC